jgi:hypothetical protein
MTTIRRYDCFSRWARRTRKKDRKEIIARLRSMISVKHRTPQSNYLVEKAAEIAADCLEKIADQYEKGNR